MVDASAKKDIEDASVYKDGTEPFGNYIFILFGRISTPEVLLESAVLCIVRNSRKSRTSQRTR